MKIGIIGAGFVGRALAQAAVAAGHDAMVSNSRGPGSLASIPSGIGARIGTVEEAATFGEIVVVAVPFASHRSVPAAWLAGKTVVDANNYYPQRDGSIPALDERRTTSSEMVAEHLSESRVVKAFNAILARDVQRDARPAGSADRRALPVAGDDPDSKRDIMHLVDQFGFDAIDAGTLAESWRFERAKPAYCVKLDQAALRQALAAAERDVDLADGS